MWSRTRDTEEVAVKPTRVVWRRQDCGAAIAQAPRERAAPRLFSLPVCPATPVRGERISDRRRSALERTRLRRSSTRGGRHLDEQWRMDISFWPLAMLRLR